MEDFYLFSHKILPAFRMEKFAFSQRILFSLSVSYQFHDIEGEIAFPLFLEKKKKKEWMNEHDDEVESKLSNRIAQP